MYYSTNGLCGCRLRAGDPAFTEPMYYRVNDLRRGHLWYYQWYYQSHGYRAISNWPLCALPLRSRSSAVRKTDDKLAHVPDVRRIR